MTVIKFAEARLKEENEEALNGAENKGLIAYWAAYLDGAKAQCEEDNGADAIKAMSKLTTGLCSCVSEYAKQMNKLIDNINAELSASRTDEE